jgi:hypothetical protein
MQALLSVVALAALLVIAPVAQAGGRGDGDRKPSSCNPQKECMARAAGLKGAAAEAAKRDCSRMPTSGTCYGAPTDAPADRSERNKKK